MLLGRPFAAAAGEGNNSLNFANLHHMFDTCLKFGTLAKRVINAAGLARHTTERSA